MDNTFTITLRIDPPGRSGMLPLQVYRKFENDYEMGYGAALRSKENIPDDAEQLARGLLDSDALARKLQGLKQLDQKTDEQRERVRRIIEYEMTRALAEGIRKEWVEDLVDETFEQIDDNDA